MHPHPNRIPQLNTFPSFTSQTTSRMVREPHRTHGNKTRMCSFTDSRTTICARCHTPTPISTLSPLVFRCPFHTTVVQNMYNPQRASPGHTCHGVTPGPCMSHSHRLLPSTVPRSRVFRLPPFLATGFRLHPPSPAQRPHLPPASGRRISITCFPWRTYGCQ